MLCLCFLAYASMRQYCRVARLNGSFSYSVVELHSIHGKILLLKQTEIVNSTKTYQHQSCKIREKIPRLRRPFQAVERPTVRHVQKERCTLGTNAALMVGM